MSVPQLGKDDKQVSFTTINAAEHSPKTSATSPALSVSSDPEKFIGTPSDPATPYTSSSAADADLVNRFYEPPDSYESKHRWDPLATWTEAEEKKLYRKVDIRVCVVACICFSALNLDRSNINNAVSDNMLKDLHMTRGDYNIGQTIFYASFLFAELPSQLISKKLGSDVWIPIQIMSWSIVAICQSLMHNKTGFFITRCLLGLIEGGFIADTILYMSYYYTANQLTVRLGIFWISLTVTNIVGAFLAAGLLQLRHITHWAGWKWLFAIEGAITFLIGAWAFWYLPAGPTQTKRRFHRGWFTEREEIIIVNKVLRDDPTKADMHNRQGLSFRDLWDSLMDYDLWPLYFLGLTMFIAPQTVNTYFTLSLRDLGFSTFHTNLLTIPSQCLTIINICIVLWVQRKTNQRLITGSAQCWWLLILFIALVTIPDNTNKWAKWVLLSLVVGFPYAHPIIVSMTSMNSGSVRTRTVASSLYNMFVQAATLIASNIYQPDDAPYYHKGNKVLLGLIVVALVMFYVAKAWYVFRNKSRAKKWDAMSYEEKEHYLATTTDKGNKRLDFRFKH